LYLPGDAKKSYYLSEFLEYRACARLAMHEESARMCRQEAVNLTLKSFP